MASWHTQGRQACHTENRVRTRTTGTYRCEVRCAEQRPATQPTLLTQFMSASVMGRVWSQSNKVLETSLPGHAGLCHPPTPCII